MNILIIAAHPDDEVLGCGGTIARYSKEGAKVSILILAEGLTSRTNFIINDKKNINLLKTHHDRAERAGKLLGSKDIKVLALPDQKLDTIPLLEITHAIETEISRVQPEIIFTHHGGDLNMDHVITFRATMTATRPMMGTCVKKLYTYETLSSTEWAFNQYTPQFKPNVFIEISPYLERKINALAIYESETREAPHPRSPETLRALARYRGSAAGLMAAEAFELVREVSD